MIGTTTRRVLITGICGFIGNAIAQHLNRNGYEVYGIDLNHHVDFKTIVADLLDLEPTIKAISAIAPCALVIHTAALAHNQKVKISETIGTLNVRMTSNLLTALEGYKCNFIFLSSVAVYGEDRRDAPISISAELRPSTEYGRSKLVCEELIKKSRENCTLLRLPPVYDEHHLQDIRKRVYFPGIKSLKILIMPPPYYSFCHINTLKINILDYIEAKGDNIKIVNICDKNPMSQHKIASWFVGREIVLPLVLLSPIYLVLSVIPGNTGYAMRCFFKKIFYSNVYV